MLSSLEKRALQTLGLAEKTQNASYITPTGKLLAFAGVRDHQTTAEALHTTTAALRAASFVRLTFSTTWAGFGPSLYIEFGKPLTPPQWETLMALPDVTPPTTYLAVDARAIDHHVLWSGSAPICTPKTLSSLLHQATPHLEVGRTL